MKVLLVKTSSMGDVIHILPAITDATNAISGIEFHWVVEEGFKEIPLWMPAVKRVIPVALRRWRKQGWIKSLHEIKAFVTELRQEKYDLVIDAQGLFKSALITLVSRGKRVGLNYRSAREGVASLFYQQHCKVIWEQHAIPRARQLMSQALNYPLPMDKPYSNVNLPSNIELPDIPLENSVLFFHGTTWATKHWPEIYWLQLARLARENGFNVLLPWGNKDEHERAIRIANASGGHVLPRLNLSQLAALLLKIKGCVAVDTGLGHLAAVLGIPTVSLYGPTNPQLTGTLGRHQYHLTTNFECAPCLQDRCKIKAPNDAEFPPCFTIISPGKVLQQLRETIKVAS